MKPTLKLVLLLLTFAYTNHVYLQECGVRANPQNVSFMDQKLDAINNSALPKSIKYIPVVVHVAEGETMFTGNEEDKRTEIENLINDVSTSYFQSEGLNFYVCEVVFYYIDNNPANGVMANDFFQSGALNYQNFAYPNALNAFFHVDGGGISYGSLPPSYPMIWMRTKNEEIVAHELGHVGGLFHTFGNGDLGETDENVTRTEGEYCFNCETAGDRICETDADGGHYNQFNCNDVGIYETDACGESIQYNASNLKNIMSYNWNCIEFFTEEQYNRMHFFWNNFYEGFFDNSDNGNCDFSIVSFNVDKNTPCINEMIQFTNASSVSTGLLWDFGDGNTSTNENPTHSYSNSGTYTVSLTIDGKTLSRQHLIGVDETGVGRPLPFVEDFEEGEIPDGWIVDNVGFDFSLGWEVSETNLYNCPGTNDIITGADGNSTHSLFVDNWSVANGTYSITTPPINIIGAPLLSFDYFYNEWAGWCPASECLELKLYYKTTCSNEDWVEIPVFNTENPFPTGDNEEVCVKHPVSAEDWEKVNVDISSLPTDSPIRFKFEVINPVGQEPIYIDNINIPSFAGEDRSCPGLIGLDLPDDFDDPNYTYLWQPVEGLNNPTSKTPFANPFEETTYTLFVYENGDIITTSQVNVDPGYDTDDLTINGNKFWGANTPGIPEKVRGTIRVKKGAKLTINNRTIQFGPNHHQMYVPDLPEQLAGILVEPGGELVLENTTLTSLDQCDILWGGIHAYSYERRITTGVSKTKNANRNNKTLGGIIYTPIVQPRVESNGSVIENAIDGIYLGYKLGGFLTNEYRRWGNATGFIRNTLFRNNFTSVAFAQAKDKGETIRFANNDFQADADFHQVEEELLFGGTTSYTRPERFVSISRSEIMEFRNNNFEDLVITQSLLSAQFNASNYSPDSFYMTGVQSFQGGGDFNKNTFKALKLGIDAYGIGTPTDFRIERNTFDGVYGAIALQNTNSTTVQNNTISMFDAREGYVLDSPLTNEDPIDGVNYPSYGVFAIASPRILLAHNEIYTAGSTTNLLPKLSRGIVVHNSGEHGADVRDNILGDQTDEYGGLGVALETQENNPALRFNCNRFSNNQQAVRLNPGGFAGSLANQSSLCQAVIEDDVQDYFPENEFLSPVVNGEEHLFADNLLLTAEGTPFRYFDNAKAIAPPDTDNGGVSQVLIDNENYDNCIFEEQTEFQDYPDPSCDMGVTTGGGGVCCKWPALDLDDPGLIKQGIENGIFRLALLEERTDELIDFLKENPTKERQKELFGLYLRQEQFTAARKVLEELPETEAPFREMGNWLVESAEKTEPTDSLRRHLPRLEALSKQNIPVAGTHPSAIAAQGLVAQLEKKRFDRWVVNANDDIQSKSGSFSQENPTSSSITLHEKVVKPKVYPNPAKTTINIDYSFEQASLIELYEVTGKEMLSHTVTAPTEHVNLPLNTINKGVYFLKVTTPQQQYTYKVIKN